MPDPLIQVHHIRDIESSMATLAANGLFWQAGHIATIAGC